MNKFFKLTLNHSKFRKNVSANYFLPDTFNTNQLTNNYNFMNFLV